MLHRLTRPLRVSVPLQQGVHYNEVLRSAADVDRAIERLRWRHPTAPKTWDLFKAAHYVLEFVPRRDAVILDAGCSGSPILELLRFSGYRELYGCDFERYLLPRVPELRFFQGDLTATPYASGFFDAVVCLSVIEHGVPLDRFLDEAGRILRPGGHLVISTDYHEPKIRTDDVARERTFGLPWTVFSRTEVEGLIASAEARGFALVEPVRWELDSPPVHWWGRDYTFIFLALQRR